MGQKVHPIGFRLGTTRTWSSLVRLQGVREPAPRGHQDPRYIKDALYHAGISKIDVERSANRARIIVHTARPGIIIGRKGAEVEKLKNELQTRTGKEIHLDIQSGAPGSIPSSSPRTSRCSSRSAWRSAAR